MACVHQLSLPVCTQGWRRVLSALRSIYEGTGLIKMVTAAGFPPFQGWLRGALAASHYVLLINGVNGIPTIIGQATNPAKPHWFPLDLISSTIGAVNLNVSTVLLMFIKYYGDKDWTARRDAVKALKDQSADAVALQPLPADLPAHASLRAALQAFAGRYLAILQRDKQRWKAMQARFARIPRCWGGNPAQ